MDDFIGQKIEQKCGDILLILEETDKRTSYGAKLYLCQFQKYKCNIFAPKSDIKKGNIGNPQKEKIEFWDKIHIQNNGDRIQVLEKTENKKGGYWLYKCKSLVYGNILFLTKTEILKSQIINPVIEEQNFTNKIWLQNCGDSLKIIEKTNQKTSDITNHYLWKCEFIKYPYQVLAEKGNIIKGRVNNPKIEEEEFFKKRWKQNCGGEIEILKKEGEKYLCHFVGYNKNFYSYKSSIKEGNILNKELPWFSKENLQLFIEENFEKKPTYKELSKKLNISVSHLNNKILEFGLRNLVNYSIEGSEEERNIKDYIQTLLPNLEINNSWSELKNGQEIDIYIPELRIGIEYNGNFWHSNAQKDYIYHQNKSLQAQSQNIFLIHIFEYEWNNHEDILKSIIKSHLRIFDKKIFARKCEIKELSNQEYQEFCDINHLQGKAGAKIKIGLYFEKELVQIMSFGCPRFTDKYEWEIIRECSKLGYCIIGGKERLWKYFVENYHPNNCLSYCDFSKFTGNSYLKIGFEKINLNKPGFMWYDEKTNEVFWRTPSKNSEYKDKYLKIYDCGQLVFGWQRNKV